MLLRILPQLARLMVAMLLLVSCAPTVSRPAPDLAAHPLELRAQFLAELDDMQLDRLYVLDPSRTSRSDETPGASYFGDYAVVREAEPAAVDRSKGRAHRGLRNILEATSAVAAACFEPGQGARFRGRRGTLDVLVCFGCNNYRITGPSPHDIVNDSFEAADAGPWRQAFAAAGLSR